MLHNDPRLWFLVFFGLGLALGTILYRSDFCMAGILRDLFLFGDRTRMRHLVLMVTLAMLFFLALREADMVPLVAGAGFAQGSLLGVAGGMVFGLGMVLAGGCVFSTLYKLAGGNLTYGLVFIGIIAGSLLYAELHPVMQQLHQYSVLGSATNLFELWPVGARQFGWGLSGTVLVMLAFRQRQKTWQVPAASEGYLQPWLAAVALALATLFAFAISGVPLGISTAYAKLGAMLENLVVPAHVVQLDYFSQAPRMLRLGDSLLYGGGGPQVDFFIYTEVALLVGILVGAFGNALLLREFRFYGWPPLRQGVAAGLGGVMLALGARMANGCNIKHLLGGLPLLSIQSLLFVGGLLAGAWLGARILPRIILR